VCTAGLTRVNARRRPARRVWGRESRHTACPPGRAYLAFEDRIGGHIP
jgi:hypothetical protein